MNRAGEEASGSGEPVPVTVATSESKYLLRPRREAGQPSILELISNPRAFFDAMDARPPGLRIPFLFVLVVGIIGAITVYLTSSALMNAIAIPGAQGIGGIFGVIGGIGALIVIVLVWVIVTAVFFVISMAFSGRGDFNRLLDYVGYGHLPQVIGGVITLALTWDHYSNLRIPSLTTPEAIQEWATSIGSDPALQLVNVIGIIFLIWSANLWIFGVRAGRKLSSRHAAITVLAPVLLYVLIIYVVLPLVM